MSEPRHFRFKTFKWHCDVWFHEDRIESAWDEWNLGVAKGKKTILRDQIQERLSEVDSVGFRAGGPLQAAVFYICATVAIHLFVPGNWARLAIIPLMLAVYSASVGLGRLRKIRWLNIQGKDGKTLLGLDTSSWSADQVAEFRGFFSAWARGPSG